MTESQVGVEYLSTGANRQTAVADWSASGVLAFGADSNVGLWTPSSDVPDGITALLGGHAETVKAVKFLGPTAQDGSSFVVSGSDDKSLKLWRVNPDATGAQCIQTVQQHSSPINCLAVLQSRKASTPVLLASGAADATIRIWSFSPSGPALELLQTIKPAPKFFPLALALTTLDQSDDVFVLAAAGTKDIVQIFVAGGGGEQAAPSFELQATLTGHEGWIRSLDFTRENPDAAASDLLLASASQDKYIRLWRFHPGKDLPSLVINSDPSSGAFLPGKSPTNKVHRLHAAGKDFSATFEALLLGHEDWIYSAKWLATAQGGEGGEGNEGNDNTDNTNRTKLQLLSTSADNSLAMWEADPASGIWVSMVRLGEISREKGATTATGSIGGFWTGLWAPDGKSVVCLGRTGSWRRWVHDAERDEWVPATSVGGHTKAVTGIAWSADGAQLLSTASDQTTRLHAQWTKRGEGDGDAKGARATWHEMSRPQIHGYDLNCVDVLGPSQFVSGADEKLMRVFSKPRAVARLLDRLGGSSSSNSGSTSEPATSGDGTSNGADAAGIVPDAANMPVLGLSNKAIEAAVDDSLEVQADDPRDRDSVDPASVVRKSALDIAHPPLEESLSRHTLWPEAEKLYGHGYELSCLAASHDGKLIASACKASSVNHAVIRLFETERWTELRPPLAAHTLTATRLRFSADDKYLLSVGRDRQWVVWERGSEGRGRGGGEGEGEENSEGQYRLLQSNPKGHTRMILDAAWAPPDAEEGSPRVFATAGRDKRVRIWSGKAAEEADGGGSVQFAQSAEITFDGPVTAVDFLGRRTPGGGFALAVGTESGKLSVYSLAPDTLQVAATVQIPSELCLPKTVLQLAWRPPLAAAEPAEAEARDQLAIAGEDSSLRIYRFSPGSLGVGS